MTEDETAELVRLAMEMIRLETAVWRDGRDDLFDEMREAESAYRVVVGRHLATEAN